MEHFTVPATAKPSRLEFAADYPFSGQTLVLHVALLEPDGTYAGYSVPQGLADYANVQVANPPAGEVDRRLLHRAERRDHGRRRHQRARSSGTPDGCKSAPAGAVSPELAQPGRRPDRLGDASA